MSGTVPFNGLAGRGRELFSLACLLGIVLGAVYDALRGMRRGAGSGAVMRNVSDFCFALLFFFCWFLFSVAQTGGMRAFTLFSMLLGALAERYTFGRVIVLLTDCVFSLLRSLWDRTAGKVIVKIRQKVKAAFVKSATKFKMMKKIRKKT